MLDGRPPQGAEAIRLVMKDGGVWTSRMMLEELRRRDWESPCSTDPLRATSAAMTRLCREKHELERVGRGHYRYIGPWAAPTP
jgi:hypothetical protein